MASPPIIVTIDSSGAQRGSEDATAAIQKILTANAALQASALNTADVISKAEVRKQQLLSSGGKIALAAAAEIQRAADLGAAAYTKVGTAITSNSQDVKKLEQYARAWDPFIAAAGRAQQALETVTSIAGKGGTEAAMAGSMIAEAAQRMNDANANLAAGFDRAAETNRLTAIFAPAATAAKNLTAELLDLNRAVSLNIDIEGGYDAAFDRIIAKSAAAAAAAENLKIQTLASADAMSRASQAQAAFNARSGTMQSNPLYGAAYDERQAGITSAFSDADAERAKYDSVFAASKNYETELTALNNVVKVLNLTESQQGVMLDELNAKFSKATGTAASLAATAADNARMVAAWDPLQAAADNYRKSLEQIDALERTGQFSTPEAATAARQTAVDTHVATINQYDPTIAAQADAAAAADKLAATNARLQATYPTLSGAVAAHKKVLDDLTLAVKNGVMTDQEAQKFRDGSAASLANFGKSIKGVGDEQWKYRFLTQQSGVQTIQFLSSLQAGQPITTAFIQQFHQMADVAVSTGLKWSAFGVVARAVGGFLAGPGGIVVAGGAVIGGLTLMGISAENTALRIERLRNSLALVRPDFTAMSSVAEQASKQLASSTFLSTADARLGAAAVTGNAGFQGSADQAAQIATAFATLSKSLGESTVDWKRLNDAMADPAATLQTLLDQNHLLGLTQGMVNVAKRMQEGGDRAGAFGIVMKVVKDATAAVTANMTPLEAALKRVSNAFSENSQKSKESFDTFGTAITANVAQFVNGIGIIIEQTTKLGNWLDSHGWGIGPTNITPKVSLGQGALSMQDAGAGMGGASGWMSQSKSGSPSISDSWAAVWAKVSSGWTGVVDTMKANDKAYWDNVSTTAADASRTTWQQIGDGFKLEITAPLALLVNRFLAMLPGGTSTNTVNAASMQDAEAGMGFVSTNSAGAPSISVDGKAAGQIITSQAAGLTYQINSLYKEKFDGFITELAASGYKINSLGGYNDRNIAGTNTPSYHAQGAAIDINPSANPVNGGNNLPPNVAEMAQKYGLGWGGNWTGGKTDPMHFSVAQSEGGSVPLQHVGLSPPTAGTVPAATAAASNGLGGTPQSAPTTPPTQAASDAANPANYGVVNPPDQTIDNAQKAADAMNLTGAAAQAAQAKIDAFQKGLALQPGNQAFIEGLQKAQLELYNAVPALTAAGRAMDLQTQGSLNEAAAWDKGAKAASDAAIASKAQTEAIQYAAPGTTQYSAAVAILTAKLTAQAAAQQAVAAAQQRNTMQDQIAYTQKEISTLNMDATARDVLLARMKAEQDLRRTSPQLTQDQIDKNLALIESETKLSDALKLQTANMNEAAGIVDQTFSTLGSSIVDAFDNGKTAAQNFSDTMTTISKAILNEFLKLAVINPLMNELFPSTTPRPTLGGVTNALNGGTGTSSGSGLFGWFGGGSSAAAASSASSISASDAATFAAQDASSLSLDLTSAFHTGGIVGVDGSPRYIHPAYFDNAPRFHQGLASDEFPAILQKGERVLTEKQDTRVLELVNRLTAQVQSGGTAGTGPINHPPSTTDRDAFFQVLAHGERTLNARRYHAGGVVGIDGAPMAAAAHYFLSAPRYHGGGLIGAILGGGLIGSIAGGGPNIVGGIAGGGLIGAAMGKEGKDAPNDMSKGFAGGLGALAFHAGGVVGRDGTPTDVSPSHFLGAPRFHTGSTTLTDGTVVPAASDAQFTGTAALPSAYDDLRTMLGVGGTRLPSGGVSITGGPVPSASSGRFSLASLAPIAGMLPLLATLGPKLGGLFSGSGLFSANTLNSTFGTQFGPGTFPTAANPMGIVPGYAADGFTPLSGAVAGVVPDVGLDVASAAAASAIPEAVTVAATSSAADLASAVASAAPLIIVHSGGKIGSDALPTRYVHPSYLDGAPRFHDGLGGDEFAAILQKGEIVLNERQQGQAAAAAGADTSNGGGGTTNHFNFNIPNLTDKATADTFMRALPQVMSRALDAQSRAKSRNA